MKKVNKKLKKIKTVHVKNEKKKLQLKYKLGQTIEENKKEGFIKISSEGTCYVRD